MTPTEAADRIVNDLLYDLPEARRAAVAEAIADAMREYASEYAHDAVRDYSERN